MLLDLNVLNGTITPEFDRETYEYAVYVGDVSQLQLDLKVDKDLPVTVYGNDYLTEGENHVLLEIFDEKVVTYVLTVYKKSYMTSSLIDNSKAKVEVETRNVFIDDILTPGIVTLCLLVIVCLYVIIFHKK